MLALRSNERMDQWQAIEVLAVWRWSGMVDRIAART